MVKTFTRLHFEDKLASPPPSAIDFVSPPPSPPAFVEEPEKSAMKIPDFVIDGTKCVLMASPCSEFEAGSTYYSPHQCKTLLNQIELQHRN